MTEESKSEKLVKALVSIMNEAVLKDTDVTKMKQSVSLSDLEKQAELSPKEMEDLRKILGVGEKQGISMNELEGVIRKVALEASPPGKRTETVTPEKPTEGPSEKPIVKPAQEIFDKLQKKKQAI